MITCHVHREPGAVEPVLVHGPTAQSGHTIRLVLKKKHVPQLPLALRATVSTHITLGIIGRLSQHTLGQSEAPQQIGVMSIFSPGTLTYFSSLTRCTATIYP